MGHRDLRFPSYAPSGPALPNARNASLGLHRFFPEGDYLRFVMGRVD
jgi:hypothetical protein